jgi:4-azaleucine resistance transporter AzlC
MAYAGQNVDAHQNGWLMGTMRALPIFVGYIPIGFAFGVLSLKVGLMPLPTILMSALVLGASSQLVALQLIALDVPPLTIIVTTFVVNLRHMLMSFAIGPHLKCWTKAEIAAFSYGLTDETFALHAARFVQGRLPKEEGLIINWIAHGSWVLGTIFGVITGQWIESTKQFALDYALTAMLIALLVIQVKEWYQIFIALLAGGLAVGCTLLGLNYWNLIISTAVCATVGMELELWCKRNLS